MRVIAPAENATNQRIVAEKNKKYPQHRLDKNNQIIGVRVQGFYCFVANAPVSVMVAVILAIKWGGTVKEKLLYIFLMPTNYTWILYFLAVVRLVRSIINMLKGVPDNFG